ncbi:rho guanine nucleotide exchange factor 5 isoform X2 [Microcaecilia unicolor]|uniref:Rho guanine nucleotide exchange factor 5 isoform X2 n=1 Tax=Microcaecilia unicolor TaxID=1415580 RepID=A0A6P7WV06_9AMPH|nr:rho guanine nucleotide exchange factor 5 isoform X2 [Microcaecilia unicolor]
MEEDGQETQSQHDPLLQQSHDDIREDLGGEEITDSDTIQQPGGDMEEDGQETQSQHDPLLQQSHDDIREDLGGEEITDSDTIQQPGGDMEEDGQETQSQHDPLLQQSHDDIREDLGGEEITDSDTIQQPGGDMEEDGQETQSHDMELPLEHNPHVCTNIVLEEAAEGRTDDIRGNSSTTEHPRTVTVSSSEEEEERQDHLIVLSHEYVICSAALASQMFSPTDGSLSSLIPKEALQKYSSVNQVTTSEDDSPASSAKADGDSKDLFSPHVESVSPAYVDLAREEFSSHAFEVPSSRGDSAAPVVLNQANCEPIICQATEGTSVGFQKMIINESQSEQNRSAGEGVDEGSEPICEGTITSTDLTSTCVDGPRMDTAHLVSDESPPTILEFFNPILIFGHSPEELGQYDFQVQSPQPSYSESITEQALNSSQTPLMEQGMSEDFSEHIHSGTQHNKHGPIRNLPHNSVTDDGSETGLFHTLRQKAAMDISGDSKMVSEENEGITLEESPAHEASSLSLVKKRTLTESLSNDETNVVPKQVFTKTSKLLQFAPVSPKSKSLPRQAAVSEEPKPSFPDADTVTTDTASLVRRPVCSQQPAGSTSDEESKEDEDLSSSDPVTLREKNALDVSTSVKRRRSRLINSSRLLYQEYSDVVLTQEIQRQKRAETFTEDGEPSSPRMRRKPFSPQDSYLQRLSVSSNASLWQDIPMIRGSSVLLNMTRDEQKLQEAKFELIMSEASYLRSLNVAVDHFQHSPDLQALLTNQERQWLFSKLQEVQDVSSTFLFDLEEKFEDDMYTFNVCDVVLNHAADFRKVYLPYVTNQSYQDQTFQQLLTGNAKFRHVLEKLESDPMCQRLSLKSFLILPFQRITRLKLLVQNILKRTQLGSKEEAEATQAHNSLEKLIKDCNENIQRMRSTEELIFLSQKIQFECKIFPLISQSRRLVKHGELLALESSLSFKWKVTTRPIYLHLFNDCLLLSRPREGGRFIVFDHARASKVRGERYEMKLHAAHKNTFRLILLENNQGRNVQFLFSTETQSKKLRWISALSPLRKEKDLLTCHDYPQVQCLKPYKARENDEISLEKADVIMVTQESNDGWQEGVRLSDGDRGWFPQSHVEQISSRHVRLRNLKEEQRIQNAKANLLPSRKK